MLFVATTGSLTSTEFVDETARINSLGANDALLLVAIDDRTDAIWVSDSLPITNEELNAVIADQLEPALGDGDFPAAVIAAAEGLGAAADPVVEPTRGPVVPSGPDPTPIVTIPPGGGTNTSGAGLLGVIGIVLLGLGIVSVVVWLASRFSSWREAEERDRRTGKLARSFRGHRGIVSSLSFSPDGGLLVSGSRDHTVKVWDASQLKEEPDR